MIEKTISKAELLRNIKENRATLEDFLSKIPKEEMLKMVEGDWSVKDIISHIISWEKNMIRWINVTLEGSSPDDFPKSRVEVDSLNEFQYQREKDKKLEDVLKEFQISYNAALSLAEGLDENIINDPELFEWRKGDAIWFIVAANTYWHYEEHFEVLENLLLK